MYFGACNCPPGHRLHPQADPLCCPAPSKGASGLGAVSFEPAKDPGVFYTRERGFVRQQPVAGLGIEASDIGATVTRSQIRGRRRIGSRWDVIPTDRAYMVSQFGLLPNLMGATSAQQAASKINPALARSAGAALLPNLVGALSPSGPASVSTPASPGSIPLPSEDPLDPGASVPAPLAAKDAGAPSTGLPSTTYVAIGAGVLVAGVIAYVLIRK